MIEILKEHWFLISSLLAGLIWAIVRGERITSLDKRIEVLEKKPAVSCSTCKDTRDACRLHYDSEFVHGKDAFKEIKLQILMFEKKAEQRHEVLVNHLLNVEKKQ